MINIPWYLLLVALHNQQDLLLVLEQFK